MIRRYFMTHGAISWAGGKDQPKVLWSKLDICHTGSTVHQACLFHLIIQVGNVKTCKVVSFVPNGSALRNFSPRLSLPKPQQFCQKSKLLSPESLNPSRSSDSHFLLHLAELWMGPIHLPYWPIVRFPAEIKMILQAWSSVTTAYILFSDQAEQKN